MFNYQKVSIQLSESKIMKRIFRLAVVPSAVAVMMAVGYNDASAWSLKDALGGGDLGETVTNVLQGVFTKSDLTVEDIAGVWTTDGSAVSFKSDNLLQKAGGLAAAGAIEAKINPYFDQLGLNNAEMTIKDDGSFTLKAKMLTLQGTLASNGDGTFEFNFKAFGKVSLGKMTAYVQKAGNHVDIMFDATKLKNLTSGIASLTGISLAKTAAALLDSYEGLCVGFGMNKTGSVESTKPASSAAANDSTSATDSSSASKAAGALFDLLKGKK